MPPLAPSRAFYYARSGSREHFRFKGGTWVHLFYTAVLRVQKPQLRGVVHKVSPHPPNCSNPLRHELLRRRRTLAPSRLTADVIVDIPPPSLRHAILYTLPSPPIFLFISASWAHLRETQSQISIKPARKGSKLVTKGSLSVRRSCGSRGLPV